MENNFVGQLIKTTLGLTLVASLLTAYYTDYLAALAVLMGSLWGIANIYFLKKSLEHWLRLGDRDHLLLFVFLQLKFPLLYVIGYFLLKMLPTVDLMIGNSLIFLSIFFLGIYKAMTDKSSQTQGFV